ncbi:MAG: septal ring lytic transglycosylase RlpA family protein [Rickettsiales bacterium]|nr:septal ring lytic transglycosylase RlpA family protein [Rickettsiales bacterium]
MSFFISVLTRYMHKIIAILWTAVVLAGCVSHRDAFTTRGENYRGHYKVGKKYKKNNVVYRPKEVKRNYDKVGYASWYGPGFYGKKTANGEVFTGRDLTAAHVSLPLPTIVRVTNLENKKSVVVRVNDRGPFRGGGKRIIDLSEYAAEILNIKKKGVALVRVKFLRNATRALHKKLGITKIRG